MSKLAHSNDETMRIIESDRLLENDPTLFRCASCGTASPDENNPCECVTRCGFRRLKGKDMEVIVWKDCREVQTCPTCKRPL